jgi:predicted RNase H-like HicB family nuclease
MAIYIALLRKEEDSNFGVDFPDFPGCITAGETLEEAHMRSPEALKLHIKGMMEDGEDLPEPSTFEEITASASNEGGMPFLVKVPDPKTKRVTITVPERDLEAIDTYARGHRLSRSSFLVKAAKKVINEERI